ncbi:MAG: 30S ribosomal protein S6 [Pseudomonadota bacterium]|nr:30S ribosomal protein S6 [Pseudomonadota bacterium]MED5274612.1 30S ribosomal protein S6 [Pseudomonadota bacterium]|tara:strand:+ start:11418 stop:11762 length:345 start_codon:yes stop_codon:yes gene_type:complete
MRNYEIVLMFDINQDSLTEQTMDKYQKIISSKGGKVDRYEDWGNLKLAYEINKNNKARYIMMNIQADNQVIDEISGLIKFNDSILRHIILQRTKAYTESSVMMNREKTNKEEAH